MQPIHHVAIYYWHKYMTTADSTLRRAYGQKYADASNWSSYYDQSRTDRSSSQCS
jgi:hypothetical protein